MWKMMPDDEHRKTKAYFPFNTWIGGQQSKIKAKKDSYSSPEYRLRGNHWLLFENI